MAAKHTAVGVQDCGACGELEICAMLRNRHTGALQWVCRHCQDANWQMPY